MELASHRRIWLISVVVFAVLFVLVLPGALGQSDWIPQIVDMVRGLPFVGPERVAAAEDAYYGVQDQWDQWVYRSTHSQAALEGTAAPAVIRGPTPTPSVNDYAGKPVTSTPVPQGPRQPVFIEPACPSPHVPILIGDPLVGEGIWTSADMPLGSRGRPPLCHTFIRPDPVRPYARVDVVRVDLTQIALSLVAGTREPRPIDGIPGPGQIPPPIQSSGRLLAAWNGGFLTLHGESGMMANRRVILPPKDGYATLAVYADGHIRLGAWGRDITMAPDLVSFRQNGPLLIDQGVVKGDEYWKWGNSVSGDVYIWRSGIGITADGALVVAVGNSVSAGTLAAALRQAGAIQAMQLDVNAWHVFFFTYETRPAGPTATKLNPDLPGSTQIFLKPYDRDFMYLTIK